MMKKRIRELLSGFKRRRLLVVGDVMLDHYVSGAVTRISPEAPVPIVDIEKVDYLAGGAGNVAVNIAALGASALLVGVVGDDPEGLILRDLLAARSVDPIGLRTVTGRPTTLKTRVLGRTQQIVRLDREVRSPVSAEVVECLLAHAAALISEVDGVVLSDYAKGVASPELSLEVIRMARAAGVPVLVDPKGRDYARYRGATVVKPNQKEAGQALNVELTTADEVVAAGWSLLRLVQCDAVLITRSDDGMILIESGHGEHHLPSFCPQALDPTGAGDVVTSVYALALAAGSTHREATFLANHAAAIACCKLGATPVTLAELRARLEEGALIAAEPAALDRSVLRPLEPAARLSRRAASSSRENRASRIRRAVME